VLDVVGNCYGIHHLISFSMLYVCRTCVIEKSDEGRLVCADCFMNSKRTMKVKSKLSSSAIADFALAFARMKSRQSPPKDGSVPVHRHSTFARARSVDPPREKIPFDQPTFSKSASINPGGDKLDVVDSDTNSEFNSSFGRNSFNVDFNSSFGLKGSSELNSSLGRNSSHSIFGLDAKQIEKTAPRSPIEEVQDLLMDPLICSKCKSIVTIRSTECPSCKGPHLIPHNEDRLRAAILMYLREVEWLEELNYYFEMYFKGLIADMTMGSLKVSTELAKFVNSLDTICNVAKGFTKDFKQVITSWNSNTCLGNHFLQYFSLFECYVSYNQNKTLALAELQRLHVWDQIEEIQSKSRHANKRGPRNKVLQTFEKFVILPAQYLEQLVIFLSSIRELTPLDHPDHTSLSAAISQLSDLQVKSSSYVEEDPDTAVLKKLESELADKYSIVKPGRVLIKKGKMMLKAGLFNSAVRYTFILLSDKLLQCQPAGKLLKVVAEYDLASLRLSRKAMSSVISNQKFDLVIKQSSGADKRVVLSLDDPKEIHAWAEALLAAIKDCSPQFDDDIKEESVHVGEQNHRKLNLSVDETMQDSWWIGEEKASKSPAAKSGHQRKNTFTSASILQHPAARASIATTPKHSTPAAAESKSRHSVATAPSGKPAAPSSSSASKPTPPQGDVSSAKRGSLIGAGRQMGSNNLSKTANLAAELGALKKQRDANPREMRQS
jgi:hypothetical protein